jgi:hypothetical protein
MAPATIVLCPLGALTRVLAVLLVSIATPVSLAVSPDDHPVSRKLDHVRHTRAGAHRLDLADATHHDVGAGFELVVLAPSTDVVAAAVSGAAHADDAGIRGAPPAIGGSRLPILSLQAGPPGTAGPRPSPALDRPSPSPGRAPPSA